MSALLRAELLKQRSVPTWLSLSAGMLGLVLFAVLLHGFSLRADQVSTREQQLDMVFRWGALFGSLFAALLGALSITTEFRHGTIRPTLLTTPSRGRLLLTKALSGWLWGGALGAVASAVATAAAAGALEARSLPAGLDAGDFALLVLGGTVASALWGAVGVGLGAVVRQPVATLVGLCTWLLFVENLLVAFVPDVGRLTPGAAGAALAGIGPDTLLAPAAGGALLAGYAVATVAAGTFAMVRRDVV